MLVHESFLTISRSFRSAKPIIFKNISFIRVIIISPAGFVPAAISFPKYILNWVAPTQKQNNFCFCVGLALILQPKLEKDSND